jgi:hypothetical protein
MFSLDQSLFEKHPNAPQLFTVAHESLDDPGNYITSSRISLVGCSWIFTGNRGIFGDSPDLTDEKAISTSTTIKTHTFT